MPGLAGRVGVFHSHLREDRLAAQFVHALDRAQGAKYGFANLYIIDLRADPLDGANFLVASDDGKGPGVALAIGGVAFDRLAAEQGSLGALI